MHKYISTKPPNTKFHTNPAAGGGVLLRYRLTDRKTEAKSFSSQTHITITTIRFEPVIPKAKTVYGKALRGPISRPYRTTDTNVLLSTGICSTCLPGTHSFNDGRQKVTITSCINCSNGCPPCSQTSASPQHSLLSSKRKYV
jgi:hypothetical protein